MLVHEDEQPHVAERANEGGEVVIAEDRGAAAAGVRVCRSRCMPSKTCSQGPVKA